MGVAPPAAKESAHPKGMHEEEVNERLSTLVEGQKEELEDFTKAAEKVWDVPQR